MRRTRATLSQLYIMKAYHLYDVSPYVTLKTLVADMKGNGPCFILFGRRDNGKSMDASKWPSVAASSYGDNPEFYKVGETIRYTIDTGNGHRFVDYAFIVDGWAKVNVDGTFGEQQGQVPALNDRINAFVFK